MKNFPLGNMKTSTPLYALISIIVFIGAVLVLILTGKDQGGNGALLVGLSLSTLPSLVAALFAERTARDVRNGVIQNKVRQGTHEALEESGVKEIVNQSRDNSPAVLTALTDSTAALRALLDEKHSHTTTGGSQNDG